MAAMARQGRIESSSDARVRKRTVILTAACGLLLLDALLTAVVIARVPCNVPPFTEW